MTLDEIEQGIVARAADGEMKLYIARVVIHVPEDSRPIYEELHGQLAKKGFVKTIESDGIDYELPDAVYAKNALTARADEFTTMVFQIAKQASGDSRPEVLVLEVSDIGLKGLKPVTKSGIKEAEVLTDPEE